MTSITFSGNGNGSISGLSLAHWKLTRRERVALAADVATGVYRYVPTKGQIASSFKVHPSDLNRELRERERKEAAWREAEAQRAAAEREVEAQREAAWREMEAQREAAEREDAEREAYRAEEREIRELLDPVLQTAVTKVGVARVYDTLCYLACDNC
jgi:Skp family chaperone for outer membrane proteins